MNLGKPLIIASHPRSGSHFLLTSILTLVLVAGCGYKGPLKLPESETFFKRYFDERS